MGRVPQFDQIIGKAVQRFQATANETSLFIDGNIILTIYNFYKIHNALSDDCSVIDARVKNLEQIEDAVCISFSNGVKIIIDVSDAGYSSPEAIQLSIPGMPIVIWN